MSKIRVTVVDGPIPEGAWHRPNREPVLKTATELETVRAELLSREPIFHRPEFGLSRKVFEEMTAPTFWEVGASGRRYSRAFVLDLLEERYQTPSEATWELDDFHSQELGKNNYLVTYTLHDAEYVTRRSTIWRRVNGAWQIIYHQGTLVA